MGTNCSMKLHFIHMFGFGCKSTFWTFQLLVLLFSMRRFADFTFHILKCREGPSFIHSLISYVCNVYLNVLVPILSLQFFLLDLLAWHWSVNILSCQFQFSVRISKKIVTLSRSICNLVNTNKLSTLSVGMLREICEILGLNVDDIKQRRKKPLIERIFQVVGECSCSRKWQQSDWTTRKTIERQNKLTLWCFRSTTLCLFQHQ